jgi:hypothetical protein
MAVNYQLTIDCADPDRLAHFWAEALHYVIQPPPAGFDTWDDWYRSVGVPEEELGGGDDRIEDPAGGGPAIWFQVVPEAKTIKNRWHIDMRASAGRSAPWAERRADIDAEAARLQALGATLVRVNSDEANDFYAIAMLDPEGNEFDVN